jgi:hypothetical protein
MRASHEPEDLSKPYSSEAATLPYPQGEESQKALLALKEAHEKVFAAKVALAGANQTGLLNSAGANVADIVVLLIEADRRLLHEIAGL